MAENSPAVRLSDEETLRRLKKYLILRKQRVPFHKAARQAGIPVATIRSRRHDDPQFLDAEKDAVAEGLEAYEEKLDELAMQGDFQALTKMLEANDPDKWGKKSLSEHRVTVVHVDASNYIDRISRLRDELERRQREMPQSAMDRNPYLHDFKAEPETVTETDDEIVDAELL